MIKNKNEEYCLDENIKNQGIIQERNDFVLKNLKKDKMFVPSKEDIDLFLMDIRNEKIYAFIQNQRVKLDNFQAEKLRCSNSTIIRQCIYEKPGIMFDKEKIIETLRTDHSWIVKKACWKRIELDDDFLAASALEDREDSQVCKIIVERSVTLGLKTIDVLLAKESEWVRVRCIMRSDVAEVISLTQLERASKDPSRRVKLMADMLRPRVEKRELLMVNPGIPHFNVKQSTL